MVQVLGVTSGIFVRGPHRPPRLQKANRGKRGLSGHERMGSKWAHLSLERTRQFDGPSSDLATCGQRLDRAAPDLPSYAHGQVCNDISRRARSGRHAYDGDHRTPSKLKIRLSLSLGSACVVRTLGASGSLCRRRSFSL